MGEIYCNSNNCQIPYDICIDILSRLPVRSLVRLMSVSKQWRFMISFDFDFIQSHLFRANQNPEYKHIIRWYQNPDFKHYRSCYYSYVTLDDHPENRISLAILDSPSSDDDDDETVVNTQLDILASYNGLLLVGIGEKNHFLWNPTTRSYRKLAGSLYHFRDSLRMYGLGYDSLSNAYKVIRIVRVISHAQFSQQRKVDPFLTGYYAYDATQVKIYNSRTNSWRRVGEFPYKIFVDQQGLIVNGAPHWIVARAEIKEYVIIYFDLVEEIFKELESPCLLVFDSEFSLGVSNGLISLLRNNEVWVMKEHGVKESWTELTTTDQSMLDLSDFVVKIRPIREIIKNRGYVFDRVKFVESPISPHIGSDVTCTIE